MVSKKVKKKAPKKKLDERLTKGVDVGDRTEYDLVDISKKDVTPVARAPITGFAANKTRRFKPRTKRHIDVVRTQVGKSVVIHQLQQTKKPQFKGSFQSIQGHSSMNWEGASYQELDNASFFDQIQKETVIVKDEKGTVKTVQTAIQGTGDEDEKTEVVVKKTEAKIEDEVKEKDE